GPPAGGPRPDAHSRSPLSAPPPAVLPLQPQRAPGRRRTGLPRPPVPAPHPRRRLAAGGAAAGAVTCRPGPLLLLRRDRGSHVSRRPDGGSPPRRRRL